MKSTFFFWGFHIQLAFSNLLLCHARDDISYLTRQILSLLIPTLYGDEFVMVMHPGHQPNQHPIDWNTRMTIAFGAAKGLHYLHNEADPPVIYRDLKSANILLDEGFHPKLSDFGLAKFGPSEDRSHVSTRVMGTHGYCAPEYASSGKLTTKSDIYSFGVVLLELITGRRALDGSHGRIRQLVEWVSTI